MTGLRGRTATFIIEDDVDLMAENERLRRKTMPPDTDPHTLGKEAAAIKIVERLVDVMQHLADNGYEPEAFHLQLAQAWLKNPPAVDEVKKLREENKELREALREALHNLLSDAEDEYAESERMRARDGWGAEKEPASFASARKLIAN